MTCDIDQFKEVNEMYGTANGDEVLRMIATRVRRLVEAGTTVSRVGEDQFVILLTEVATQAAGREFLERLHAVPYWVCLLLAFAASVLLPLGVVLLLSALRVL